jgi:heme/copper-type cytochrome/quinol oxidase subunit 3
MLTTGSGEKEMNRYLKTRRQKRRETIWLLILAALLTIAFAVTGHFDYEEAVSKTKITNAAK